jgi:hypothetical protein
MEYQTIKENGEVKFVVLPIKLFQSLLDRLEDQSDLGPFVRPKTNRFMTKKKQKTIYS